MDSNSEIDHPILFFDGVCNLCNSSVQFIIKRDKKGTMHFASLQSQKAKETLPSELIVTDNLQSLVLVDKGEIFTKSTAALRISKRLSGLWPLLYVCLIFPKFLRDGVYDIIAKNRYEWFGKKNECMIPTPDVKNRFYD